MSKTAEAIETPRRRKVSKWALSKAEIAKALATSDRRLDEEIATVLQLRGFRRSKQQWRRLQRASGASDRL